MLWKFCKLKFYLSITNYTCLVNPKVYTWMVWFVYPVRGMVLNCLYFSKCRFCSVSLFRALIPVVIVDFQEQWWKIVSRPSMSNLRSSIKGNLSGQFLIASCESLWGWLLPKFYCLLTDHSSNVLGMFSHFPDLIPIAIACLFCIFFILKIQLNLCEYGFLRDRPMIENGKNPGKYIRYTPEDLERMLSEFFEGKTWNEQKR